MAFKRKLSLPPEQKRACHESRLFFDSLNEQIDDVPRRYSCQGGNFTAKHPTKNKCDDRQEHHNIRSPRAANRAMITCKSSPADPLIAIVFCSSLHSTDSTNIA